MSFNFVIPEFNINGNGTPDLQFYKRGFNLGGTGTTPSWQDIILSGNTALTLVNSKADGLNYVKLFGATEQVPQEYIDSVILEGKCEQRGTPTSNNPVDIVCNNGVLKVSPNLLNNPVYKPGYIESDGRMASNAGTILDFFPVSPNTTYTFTYTRGANSDYYDRICGYSSNNESTFTELLSQKDFRSYSIGDRLSATFTTGVNTNYIAIGILCGNGVGSAPTDAQLEIGSTATPYHPYGAIYTVGTQETVTDANGNVANCEMLLNVDTYKDTQEIISGAITHNVGIRVLDGTENWDKHSSGAMGMSLPHPQGDDNLFGYCSHFLGVQSSVPVTSLQLGQFKMTSTSSSIYFKTEYDTTTAWTQFLADQYAAGTPVIVVYPLATATTETVTAQPMQTTDGDNIVDITQASIDNLGLEVSYKATV